jgi:hypothetical protein
MIELSKLYQMVCFSPQVNQMARSYWTNSESTQKTAKILQIASENSLGSHLAHQSPENLQFFDKYDFRPNQYLFNNFSPFHLPETRSIPCGRDRSALSSGTVVWKNIIEFWYKQRVFLIKKPKKI